MPKTLLVDTNRAAYPIYLALCDLGHEVWVVGANPSETLAKLAENYVQLDYSDKETLSQFIDEKKFDYLIPGCTDLSYQICAEISNGRFPGIDTTENTNLINAKDAFRRKATELKLPVPQVLNERDALETDAIIIKPVDAYSGRGINVLYNPTRETLNEAISTSRDASRSGKVIIEEFVEGQLYSHSAFISNKKVVADFVVQEDCTTNPFTVDTSRLVPDFPAEVKLSLNKDISILADALGLNDGLLHSQFIYRDGRYWIIEMTRRCPGDIYSLLIEFSTGYQYASNYAAPFIGEEIIKPDSDKQEYIIRHTVSTTLGAALWGYQFSSLIDIRLFVPLASSGDYIGASPSGRAGIFFFRTSSLSEQEALYQKLLNGDLYRFS